MRKNLTTSAFASISVLLCSMAGLAQQAAPPQKPNVVLIALDQLRAGQLHCYGNPRADSPNIDRLARRGVRFSHFFTVASWTSPSFASLHTSLYPSKHGVTLFWRPGMPLINKDTPMLAQVFRNNGYHTAAFVDNGLAGKPLTGRGFDEYYQGQRSTQDVNITQRLPGNVRYVDPATTTHVLSWLNKHKSGPFFLYVHFLAPHSPYDPPPQDDLFKSGPYSYMTNTGYDIARGALFRLAMLGDQNAIARLYQLYDGKIHFSDRHVGEILDRIRALGLDRNTLIVLTSDHGELLYSHPKDFLTFDHRSLYDTDLHIPLIIAGPGVPKGKVIDGLGSNVDTTPTILALTHLPNLSDAEGHSLGSMIRGKAKAVNQYVFAEEDVAIPLRCIRSTRYKLILNLWTGKEQLFDEGHDPGELTNVARSHPTVVKELDGKLREWMKNNTPPKAIQLRRWRIYTAQQKVITVDDQTIGGRMLLTGGGWESDTALHSGDFGGGCFWTTKGDGSRTAVWRSDNPMLGTYKVWVYYGRPAVGSLATDAPFTIVTNSGSKITHVNFNKGAGKWQLLGEAKNPRYVRETNAADGAIIVDAVRFQRIAP